MFWNRPKSPLDPESEAWLIDCWGWLLENLADLETFRQIPLILPTAEFFPPTEEEGHARAEHVFRTVARLTGTHDWPFVLKRQEEGIDPVVGAQMVVQNIERDPLGTFSVGPDQPLTITYDPALVGRPMNLVATFVHEIAHGILLGIDRDLPGGQELEEWATDLTTVFLGFGVFGANSALEFHQFTDIGAGSQGWSFRGSGYLSEAEWAFALGVFLALKEESYEELEKWLKPAPMANLKQSMRYLDKHPERLAALKQGS